MHQTFYIEAEDEISSVIEKLRKSLAVDNYFVVPKRALFVQSIVNIKLLKREAEKARKGVVIVTADEQIMRMAERAGVKTQTSMEGLDFIEDKKEDLQKSEFPTKSDSPAPKRKRLGAIGSSDYHGVSSEKDISEEATDSSEESSVFENSDFDAVKEAVKKPVRIMDDFRKSEPRPTRRIERSGYDLKESLESFLDPEKEKKLEKMFHSQPQETVSDFEKSSQIEKNISGGRNFFFISAVMVLLVLASIAGYLLIPRADVVVYLDTENKKIVEKLTADISQVEPDFDNMKIRSRIVEKEGEENLSFSATGISDSAGQKSKGSLVIYNEYSSSPQPLVATTRFETEDGKIFRLVKGVSVPGTVSVGGKQNPGAIEVEVVADIPGDAHNVGPSSFKIPGFKGTDKYDKIYAKSTKTMIGGGLSGDMVKIVNQSDIDAAKEKTEAAAKEKIGELIKGELQKGEMVVLENSKFEITDSVSNAKNGDLKNSFEYGVKAKMSIFIISEEDLRKIAEIKYERENKKAYKYAIENIDVELAGTQSDFESGLLEIDMRAQISAKPIFDSEGFREKMTSKNEDQIRELMGKEYPQVKNLEIATWPFFLSSTPRFEKRIVLEIKDYQGR